MVILQEVVEIPFLVDHQALYAAIVQQIADRLDPGGGRVDMQLQPLHRFVPKKKMPSVPAPVWLPITGPM